jgi:hypothetical protein
VALVELGARLHGIEVGVVELLLRSTRKMRDRIAEQARRLGTKSPAGKNANAAAQGMADVVGALETMLMAATTDNDELRARAEAQMRRAHKLMTGLG